MGNEVGRLHVVDVEAGAVVPPEGHFLYARDTDNTYSSDGTTLTLFATGSGSYSDEEAQDAVGGILTDTATIDLTYSDATPSITADVKDDSITYAKIQNVATDRLLGRDTAGSGDVEEISMGSGMAFTGSGSITPKSRTLYIDSSTITIASSVTETNIFSYAIPANTLGASDRIDVNLLGAFLNNTGLTRGYIFKVKLGGSTVIEFDASTTWSTSSIPRLTIFRVSLVSKGATNSQMVFVEHLLPSRTGLFGTLTTGTGTPIGPDPEWMFVHSGLLSTDMTSSQTLAVTITLSNSSSNLTWNNYSSLAVLSSQ